MKATTLVDVYNTLIGNKAEEIVLDEQLMDQARNAINRMVEAGK